jgi:uncharacterized protein (DUF58 family)
MKSRITRTILSYLNLFAGLFFLGLILSIPILIIASLVPALFIIVGLIIPHPELVAYEIKPIKKVITVGETLEVTSEITLRGGFGVFTLSQIVPPELELASGSNIVLIWKGFGTKTVHYSYTIRCPKRGTYIFLPAEWQARHLLGMMQTKTGVVADSGFELTVKLKTPKVRRIRVPKGSAISPVVIMDAARIGAVTTDFKDIRDYVQGDPLKTINWKATAKRAYNPFVPPLVNEYEREGMKAVWVFLDADPYMEFGDTIENCFEYALIAAQNVTYYFIRQGYRTGMYIYNGDQKIYYPDTGTRQLYRISRELMRTETVKRGETLKQAVEKCHGFIVRYSPMCVVITRLDSEKSDTVYEGLLRLISLRRRYGRRMPVLVLGINGYNLIQSENKFDDNTKRMNALANQVTVSRLRATGASVIEWDPAKEDIFAALIRQRK